jgi:hypothetical protein
LVVIAIAGLALVLFVRRRRGGTPPRPDNGEAPAQREAW